MKSLVTKPPRAAFNKLLLNEARLAWRLPLGIVLGLGLPVLLLVIFGSIPALTQTFPVLIGMSVLMLATIFLPRVLVAYREQGVLRRFSITPVPPIWLLAAQVIVNLCLAVVGIAILTIVGIAAFGLRSPQDLLAYVLCCLLTISSLFAIGLFITAIAKNNGVANAIGALFLYIMLFFGGLWIPIQVMPHGLRDVSNWMPLGASVSSIQNAMQGHFPSLQSLVCLAAYTLVFGYLAIRYFRWE
jgi:ABC-2 type transport system permease protein